MCLTPATAAYANAGVRLRILGATHRYGFSLVVDPGKVKAPKDLERPEVRIACLREGTASDLFLHRTVEKFGLSKVLIRRTRRMNPFLAILAISRGEVDAAFLPEHWASLVEELGFKAILTAQQVWPDMPGSVIVIREEALRRDPDLAEALQRVNRRATLWINSHRFEATELVRRALSIAEPKGASASPLPALTRAVIERAMARLSYDDRSEGGPKDRRLPL